MLLWHITVTQSPWFTSRLIRGDGQGALPPIGSPQKGLRWPGLGQDSEKQSRSPRWVRETQWFESSPLTPCVCAGGKIQSGARAEPRHPDVSAGVLHAGPKACSLALSLGAVYPKASDAWMTAWICHDGITPISLPYKHPRAVAASPPPPPANIPLSSVCCRTALPDQDLLLHTVTNRPVCRCFCESQFPII